MEIFHIVLVTRLFNYHGISSSRSRSALFVSICLVAKPVSKFGLSLHLQVRFLVLFEVSLESDVCPALSDFP